MSDWDRASANVMTWEGYRVLRYRFMNHSGEVLKTHYEAWGPKPASGIHRMLGIRSTAKAAMALCEAHQQENIDGNGKG